MGAVLWDICQARGYQALATLDPVAGELRVGGRNDKPAVLQPYLRKRLTMDQVAGLLQTISEHPGPPVGLLVPYAHRLFPAAGLPEPALLEVLGRIEALGHAALPTLPTVQPDAAGTPGVAENSPAAGGSVVRLTPFNTVFWLAAGQEELHPAFPLSSPSLRLIRVPVPTLDDRRGAAEFAMRRLSATAEEPTGLRTAESAALADVTHGMTVKQVFSCGDVAVDRGLMPEQYGEAARLLRVGVTDDPWSADALREKIKTAEEYLNKRVLGQERAVKKTMDVLFRSAVGLNGAHLSSSPNRPRGVLFLAGPTGVGKTELAKAIASLVLGGDAQPLRFDMSEFRADEAHQRLIGAPPGYVGYDTGGELTNAVRANPVCVLLFDEIEKAHPRIFDLFLQILEDGRLTDGRGATVYFTESFLIFTSNLGVADVDAREGASTEVVNPGMDARQVEKILRDAYEDFFNRGIGRPELRNRLGDNYVALHYIDEDTAVKIVDKALTNVVARIALVLKASLQISDEARETIIDQAKAKIADGGRGVNNVVEATLVNPLARRLFTQPVEQGGSIRVLDVRYDDNTGWDLCLE